MTVEIKEISKRSEVETAEDDLPQRLAPSGISSEIDYLKRLKLKSQIAINGAGAGGLSEQEKAIASFKSLEDTRIEKYYSNLIKVYQASIVEVEPTDETGKKAKLDAKMKLAYLYSIYGYKNLYSLAHDLSEVERVQKSNDEIKELSNTLGVNT